MAAAMGMSTGMALKTSFYGSFLKQKSDLGGNKTASHVALAVRAGGYDEELVKTAVRTRFDF